jgi:hypothetical protein
MGESEEQSPVVDPLVRVIRQAQLAYGSPATSPLAQLLATGLGTLFRTAEPNWIKTADPEWIKTIIEGLTEPRSVITLPPMTVSGEGTVTARAAVIREPKLPEQLAKLSCSQKLMIMFIGLSLLLYFDLPPQAKDHLVDLITVLSAAIWLGAKITKGR